MRSAIREAAGLVPDAVEETISSKQVTYDIHRQIKGGEEVATSEFAEAIAENIEELA